MQSGFTAHWAVMRNGKPKIIRTIIVFIVLLSDLPPFVLRSFSVVSPSIVRRFSVSSPSIVRRFSVHKTEDEGRNIG